MRRAIVAAVAAAFAPDSARACGGFFCNTGDPVEQAAEQIAFFVDKGEIEAHIQIKYAGPPSEFAWILPLPASPTLGVGTDELFNVLASSVGAQPWFWYDSCGCGGDVCDDEGEGEAEGEGEVEVEFRGAVGPYDAAVLTSDDPTALLTWLSDNDYDLAPGADDVIDDYVALGFHFVALKLLADSDAGDIVPLVATFAFDLPCIPIRLTAIAALANMPIRAWVFGDMRAVSTNYPMVEPNWAGFAWSCSRYWDTAYDAYWAHVTRAVDEAGGRAFVTEYAGTTAPLDETLYWEGRFDLPALSEQTHPVAWLLEIASQGFPRNAQLLGILMEHVPPMAGYETPQDFYNTVFFECWCPSSSDCECDEAEMEAYMDGLAFDVAAATADLETLVVEPMTAAQAAIDEASYVTTLSTTMSPEEMTVDPVFDFRDDLGDVAAVAPTYASAVCKCPATYHIDLPGDRGLDVGVEPWDCVAADAYADVGDWERLLYDMPAAERAWMLGAGGAIEIFDNAATIDDLLSAHNAAVAAAAGCEGESEAEAEAEGEAEGEAEAEAEGEAEAESEAELADESGGCGCALGLRR